MKNRRLIPAALLCILCVGATCWVTPQAQAVWIWTPQTHKWVNPKTAPKDTPRTQFEWALSFFESADYVRAAKEFLSLVRFYPRSETAPEAQYLAGVSYELQEKLGEAFVAYKKVVEIYPFSSRFKDAIEREFAIAEMFFSGKRLKIIGPVSFPSLDKAVEIYQHVVAQAPYGDYGAISQYRLGECYDRQGLFEEGSRAFQKVISDYPTAALVSEAKYNVAFCSYRLSLKPSYDQSATDEAISWFESFIQTHPESTMIPQAKAALEKLRGFKAQGLIQVAAFYEMQKKPQSAAVYYQQVVDKYPDTPEAAKAIAKLAEMESGAKKK